MKILTLVLFILTISFSQIGNIDMHGGNYDSLSNRSNFNKPISFSSMLEKKRTANKDKNYKRDKKQ